MNVSLYQAAAALDANSKWQEAISENLSSSSVPGYKHSQLSQEAIQAGLMPAQGLRGVSPHFSLPKTATSTNFEQGDMKYTGQGTDVAIEGKGFFEVQLPSGQKLLTRDGEFQVNSQGQLVTKESYVVLGQSGPIQVGRENGDPISISNSGAVSQGSTLRGKLLVMSVANQQALKQVSGGYFLPAAGAAAPVAAPTQLRSGYLEASNSSTLHEMVNMLTASRSFEANQKVIQIQDDRLGKAISDLGSPQ